MSNGCNGDCFSNYNKDDDDFVIQRLQDIITICEFLIKHEKNSKSKKSLKDIFEQIEKENEKEQDVNDGYKFYINRYKPNGEPYWILPYYYRKKYPWDSNTYF